MIYGHRLITYSIRNNNSRSANLLSSMAIFYTVRHNNHGPGSGYMLVYMYVAKKKKKKKNPDISACSSKQQHCTKMLRVLGYSDGKMKGCIHGRSVIAIQYNMHEFFIQMILAYKLLLCDYAQRFSHGTY